MVDYQIINVDDFPSVCCSDEHLKREESDKDENVHVPIYKFGDCAIRESNTCFCKFSGEETKDEGTSGCYKSITAILAGIRAERDV